jgi:hypothetical protein
MVNNYIIYTLYPASVIILFVDMMDIIDFYSYKCKNLIKNGAYMQVYFGNIAIAKIIDAYLPKGYNVAIKQHKLQNIIMNITKREVAINTIREIYIERGLWD